MLILLLTMFGAAAQESPVEVPGGFSIGGGGLFSNDFVGGYCDVGFNLVRSANGKSALRNHFHIGGGADFASNLQFFVRERLFFGTAVPVNEIFIFRHYYTLDFGVGFFNSASRSKQFFELPLLLETRLGAGLDFIVKRKSAFFIESGISVRFLTAGSVADYSGLKMLGGFISIGRRRLY